MASACVRQSHNMYYWCMLLVLYCVQLTLFLCLSFFCVCQQRVCAILSANHRHLKSWPALILHSPAIQPSQEAGMHAGRPLNGLNKRPIINCHHAVDPFLQFRTKKMRLAYLVLPFVTCPHALRYLSTHTYLCVYTHTHTRARS